MAISNDNETRILPKGAKDCPTCNGTGYHYGNEGLDAFGCMTCKGRKKVIEEKLPERVILIPAI